MAMPKGYRKNRKADCHPDRPYYAKGKCHACYEAQRPTKVSNPEVARRHNVKTNFDISVEEYDRLRQATDVCGVCKKPFGDESQWQAVLDHNHDTKQLRGFIHRRCNSAIGFFSDDPVLLRMAAEYLEKHAL